MRTRSSTPRRSALAGAAALLLTGVTTACSPGTEDSSITVSAPSSLQAVMAAIATEFEEQHPGARVTVAGPSAASADVIATDDEASMDRLGRRVIGPRRFASNSLVIVVPAGNPGHVTGFADLARSDLRVAVCSGRLPCGAAVVDVERIESAALTDPIHVDSGEAAVAYVASGRADAALAYQTQARPGLGVSVSTVDDPVFAKAINRYPIAVVRSSDDKPLAEDFVKAVIGPTGGEVLSREGFGPPSG